MSFNCKYWGILCNNGVTDGMRETIKKTLKKKNRGIYSALKRRYKIRDRNVILVF